MALKYGQTSDINVEGNTYNFKLGHVERVFTSKNDMSKLDLKKAFAVEENVYEGNLITGSCLSSWLLSFRSIADISNAAVPLWVSNKFFVW